MDVLGFGANSAHRLLGFEANSQNTFSAKTLVSSGAVNMMFTDGLFLHCGLPNTNVNKGTGTKETFHASNAFAKLTDSKQVILVTISLVVKRSFSAGCKVLLKIC
jgi:hypothetical protein